MIMLIMAINKRKNEDNTEVLSVDFAKMQPFYSAVNNLMNVSGFQDVADLPKWLHFINPDN